MIRDDLFWAKVRKSHVCWVWTGAMMLNGYGQVGRRPKHWMTHRYSWTISNGEIPIGLSVLHKCDNRACVRPDHLFLGTQKENVQDMIKKGRHFTPFSVKSHCVRGHDLAANFRVNKRGFRVCSKCPTEIRRERVTQIKKDPELLRAYRAKNALSARKWREKRNAV